MRSQISSLRPVLAMFTKKVNIALLFTALANCIFCSSCQRSCEPFKPNICYYPPPCLIESRPSAFTPLTAEECKSDWGKEIRLAYAFGKQQDFYRAITGFKSALVFLPKNKLERKMQIEYGIIQSYYLGCKYRDAIEYFEGCELLYAPKDFPAYHDLLILLYDAYLKIDNEEKACNMLGVINQEYPNEANTLILSKGFLDGDIPNIKEAAQCSPDKEEIDCFINEYLSVSKDERRAQVYQALLPGAGYLYVGQKDAARTSFLINLLFTWAAYQFFDRGYIAAGIITASLEAGWYFGGINGARLEAREFNERLFGVNGREFMRCHGYFPILMLETTF
ncbi:MAG: tetratricopeptide repeat protein [Parachlamydiaceae bacterium]|nr:tetratricopeptide repeat protein [Parachlamydiaceae bacterium]